MGVQHIVSSLVATTSLDVNINRYNDALKLYLGLYAELLLFSVYYKSCLAVHYVSHRMVCKLLKDDTKSATRKAQRGIPTSVYIYSVSKTTLRAASLVQVGSTFDSYFLAYTFWFEVCMLTSTFGYEML
ncbi:uncharacterized protein LOC120007674 [Tripterygium wilfordii]|uniref:uncharacterized protein LOC120007674 n=1 Tax=Tripterygium wilfordii TaxID=458696 RepID=UPI0018F82224|nr:uncharacterized protein LOC120007674 [Tripterygium wilfordii]